MRNEGNIKKRNINPILNTFFIIKQLDFMAKPHREAIYRLYERQKDWIMDTKSIKKASKNPGFLAMIG